MVNTSGSELGKNSGLRKAAILMVMLGDEASSTILRQLDEDEVQEISREIARVGSLTSEEAEGVLEEFYQMAVAHDYVVKGGIEYAKQNPDQRVRAGGGQEDAGPPDEDAGQRNPQLRRAAKNRSRTARQVHSQRASADHRADSFASQSFAGRGLLFSLPAEMRSDVALRMASLDQISPEIISKIAKVIGSKLKSLGEMSRESYGGVHAVAEMFNRLDSNSAKEILENIEQVNPNLVETIRHLMFVFEDLLLLDVNAVKEVLAKVDRKILTIALKGTSEQMKNHMLQAMSQRGAEMLREDMDALGPIKIKEVEASQQQIIAVVRQLETEGVISLKGTAGEQYVL